MADPPGPRNDSAAKLAMVGVLTPGPVAMDLLTQVQIHRLDDVVTLTGPAVGVATISDGRRRLRRPPRGGWRMTSGL